MDLDTSTVDILELLCEKTGLKILKMKTSVRRSISTSVEFKVMSLVNDLIAQL